MAEYKSPEFWKKLAHPVKVIFSVDGPEKQIILTELIQILI